jgi:hypothetical protein
MSSVDTDSLNATGRRNMKVHVHCQLLVAQTHDNVDRPHNSTFRRIEMCNAHRRNATYCREQMVRERRSSAAATLPAAYTVVDAILELHDADRSVYRASKPAALRCIAAQGNNGSSRWMSVFLEWESHGIPQR